MSLHSNPPISRLLARAAGIASLGLLALMLPCQVHAHGPEGDHAHDEAEPSEAPTAPDAIPTGLARLADGSVQMPKPAQRRLAIRTMLASKGEHSQTVLLNGRVVSDPRSGARIQASVAGRIEAPEQGLPLAGRAVQKGELLAWLVPSLGAAERGQQQGQLAQLRAARALAEQRAARLSQLEGSVPRKDIEAAQAESRSLREQEQVVGRTLGQREPVRAPMSGVIASSSLLAGQVVEPGAVLFEVVDPRRALIEAEVTDPAVASQVTQASLQGFPQARLHYVGAARALRNGALPMSFTVDTNGAMLAIGQPVTVVAALQSRIAGVAIPAQALARNPSNETIVWIKTEVDRFMPVPVQTRALDASTVVVTQGLSPGQRVVVQGAHLINQIR